MTARPASACPVCRHPLAEAPPPSLAEHWQAIKGNLHAKRATEIALAGLHTIGFIGHPDNKSECFLAILGELAHWIAPCSCGYFNNPFRECICGEAEIMLWRQTVAYLAVKRCNLVIDIVQPKARDLLSDRPQEPFSDMLARIQARMNPAEITPPDTTALKLLEYAITRLGFSARRVEQVRAVALTIATLDHSPGVQSQHIAEAIQYGQMETI